jgi:hypothetical protein
MTNKDSVRFSFAYTGASPVHEWGAGVLSLMRDQQRVAYVSYDLLPDRTIQVGWLCSYDGGKGYARVVMEYLYAAFPDALIEWGLCEHPASAHLAADFEERYYTRTSYDLPDCLGVA